MTKTMDQQIEEFNAALERANNAKPGESLGEHELSALLVQISREAPSSQWFLHIARKLLEHFQVRAATPIGDVWLQTFLGFRMKLPTFESPSIVGAPTDPLCHITLEETAAVLSRICRFGARTRPADKLYTVAQHSVHCADLVAALGGTPAEQFEAINHEGDEALLGFDPPSPMLRLLPDLRDLKARAGAAYARRYGLPEKMSEVVKRADLILLATEKRDLMAAAPDSWGNLPPPLKRRTVPWTNPYSRFCSKWRQLAKAAGYEGVE